MSNLRVANAMALAAELEYLVEPERLKRLTTFCLDEPFDLQLAVIAIWIGNQLGQTDFPNERIAEQIAAIGMVIAREVRRVHEQKDNPSGIQ